MGGWYNKEMTSIESFRGLRFRIPGLGGELVRRLGAIVINLPAGEIVPALKSGALDAAKWVGPDLDLRLGLHTAAKYYYYPGIHEPANLHLEDYVPLNNMRASSVRCDSDFRTIASRDPGPRIYDIRQ